MIKKQSLRQLLISQTIDIILIQESNQKIGDTRFFELNEYKTSYSPGLHRGSGEFICIRNNVHENMSNF